MKIHTKPLNGNGSRSDTVEALFTYAKEVLGDSWTMLSTGKPNLVLTDPTGSGEQGWEFTEGGTVIIYSNGARCTSSVMSEYVSGSFTNFTGLVWETNNGSVGLGYVGSDGKYTTWYMLIKFDGQYNGKSLYGLALNYESGHGNVIMHGGLDVGAINQCIRSGIGSGIYLHTFYDPISGLGSSDVFGPQSMDSAIYAKSGSIVKQGNNSYMSVLGGVGNVETALFVKM